MTPEYFDTLTARISTTLAAGVTSYESVGLPLPNGTLSPDWLRDLDDVSADQRAALIAQLTAPPNAEEILWAVKIVEYLNTGANS